MKVLRKVMEMPWLQPGMPPEEAQAEYSEEHSRRIVLRVFLAVVTSLFFLFVMAYAERMELADWRPVSEPSILWINTALLVIASIAMQRARSAADRGVQALNNALLAGGLMALAFLAGQYLAWRQMWAGGYYGLANPAMAFFYLLTVVHGLHLLGGLYVWGRTLLRSWRGVPVAELRLSIELCSVYWHYLLLVWLVVFTLLLNT
ncbi:MAG: cytochrome-c oxidase [Xanthomonadales bacterium]|nr:cytochrome-c oxidase [Xanthomonadales bacterium]NIN59061.1 cytochrome-c oxidase [Xanthomonadales bacterium]NIN74365.1 cytochrome-c oxidase [Xanthomonadales bacterium]NIO13170.1 cytochrome-c oxidase [Xanthomonadales bacterium]NIP11454.1 cytochrome-c oxidase [Xanthomonadales bacterium]